MSYSWFYSPEYSADDAGFRNWGKKISDAMTAVGVTKTADTGQIDWATATRPASGGTYSGYEIRQFTDDIQATNPVVIKIEFGCATGGVTYPMLRISVGRASDGAGALAGDVSAYFWLPGANSTTEYPSFVSSDGGRLELGLWVTYSAGSLAFWIERFKDSDGTPNADGINICSITQTNNRSSIQSYSQILRASGAAYPATPIRFMCAIPNGVTCTYNENIGLFPIHPNIGYAGNPDLGALAFKQYELLDAGSFFTTNLYGSNHTFVIIASATYINSEPNLIMLRCE